MAITTEPVEFEFDRHGGGENARTRAQVHSATTPDGAHCDRVSIGPVGEWRPVDDPAEIRPLVMVRPARRAAPGCEPCAVVSRPSSLVLVRREDSGVRLEFYESRGQIECPGEAQCARPFGLDLSQPTDGDLQIHDPTAFLAAVLGAGHEMGESTARLSDDAGIRPPSSAASEPLGFGQPGDTTPPKSPLDRRVPQRGWEQDYGVPSYVVGAADVLYYHRRRVSSHDVATIDAAILRLLGPWIRRDGRSSPIPHVGPS